RSAGRMRFKKRMATAIPKMETEIKSACLMAPIQFAGDAITETATLYFSACVSASRRTEERYTLPHDSHVQSIRLTTYRGTIYFASRFACPSSILPSKCELAAYHRWS